MTIIFHSANNLPVGQRQSDGYLNATAMCKTHKKKVADWLRLESTLELVVALAEDLNTESFVNKAELLKGGESRLSKLVRISDFSDLVFVKKGSPENGGGTWLHPDLAVQLAQWCSPKFAIQVSRWVREWMLTAQNPIARSPQAQPSTTASPAAAALPPAPGWTQEDWDKLPLADQYHFSETPEQSALRRAADWNDIFRYLAMKNW